jgi:hypothetical protein
MSKSPPKSTAKIDATFRNGSMTAIGIILGFSLSFITRWGANPVPWQVVDLFAVVPLLTGIAFQIWAFATMLKPESIEIEVYTRAKNHFLLGLMGVLAGTGIAILLDILKLSTPDMLR